VYRGSQSHRFTPHFFCDGPVSAPVSNQTFTCRPAWLVLRKIPGSCIQPRDSVLLYGYLLFVGQVLPISRLVCRSPAFFVFQNNLPIPSPTRVRPRTHCLLALLLHSFFCPPQCTSPPIGSVKPSKSAPLPQPPNFYLTMCSRSFDSRVVLKDGLPPSALPPQEPHLLKGLTHLYGLVCQRPGRKRCFFFATTSTIIPRKTHKHA